MTKNTYNPYEIMMDKYDKEEMLSDVREAMLYQLGVDVSCEELDHFFAGKGKAALPGCAEWQQCFSEFVRRAAMDREVTVIEGMDELLRELRYQGNNLNQLTVMARQGRITQVNYEPFTEVYRNAWQTLNSLLSHAV